MDLAKIRLSPSEMELVSNGGWILTKNDIMQKATQLLEHVWRLQEQATAVYKDHMPSQAIAKPGKISRGENYRGLPYLVLDHPRCFEKENVFAIRSMFWWGHFFSVTLHLAGSFKKKQEGVMMRSYQKIADGGFFISIHDSPWEHHFEPGNYLPVKELGENEWKDQVSQKDFLKLSQKIALHDWDVAPALLLGHYIQILKLIEN